MRRMVEKILRQYGTVVVCNGTQKVRAFFQSVTGKVERLALAEPGHLGLESTKRYVYIGPVEPLIAEDGLLTVDGKDYRIRSVQQIYGAEGEPVYTWAMCVEKGGDEQWVMNG